MLRMPTFPIRSLLICHHEEEEVVELPCMPIIHGVITPRPTQAILLMLVPFHQFMDMLLVHIHQDDPPKLWLRFNRSDRPRLRRRFHHPRMGHTRLAPVFLLLHPMDRMVPCKTGLLLTMS